MSEIYEARKNIASKILEVLEKDSLIVGDSDMATFIESLNFARRLPFDEALDASHKGKLVKSISHGVYIVATRKRVLACRHREGDRYEDLQSRHTRLTPEMIRACDWVVVGDRPNARREQHYVPLPINKYPSQQDKTT